MITYIIIFISKILETMIGTLRLIVVANGKKILGAILQGIISLIWIIVTGMVIIDLNKSIPKIIVFCIGCIVGSYLGSLIEEKTNNEYLSVTCNFKKKYHEQIKELIKNNNYKTSLEINHSSYVTISIIIRRKKLESFKNIIINIDPRATITTNKIKILNNSLMH